MKMTIEKFLQIGAEVGLSESYLREAWTTRKGLLDPFLTPPLVRRALYMARAEMLKDGNTEYLIEPIPQAKTEPSPDLLDLIRITKEMIYHDVENLENEEDDIIPGLLIKNEAGQMTFVAMMIEHGPDDDEHTKAIRHILADMKAAHAVVRWPAWTAIYESKEPDQKIRDAWRNLPPRERPDRQESILVYGRSKDDEQGVFVKVTLERLPDGKAKIESWEEDTALGTGGNIPDAFIAGMDITASFREFMETAESMANLRVEDN